MTIFARWVGVTAKNPTLYGVIAVFSVVTAIVSLFEFMTLLATFLKNSHQTAQADLFFEPVARSLAPGYIIFLSLVGVTELVNRLWSWIDDAPNGSIKNPLLSKLMGVNYSDYPIGWIITVGCFLTEFLYLSAVVCVFFPVIPICGGGLVASLFWCRGFRRKHKREKGTGNN